MDRKMVVSPHPEGAKSAVRHPLISGESHAFGFTATPIVNQLQGFGPRT